MAKPGADPLLPAAPAEAEPSTTQSGLTKRVRGAQLPDLGVAAADPHAARPADEVRSTLASLQRGLDLGRQRGNDD